MDRLVLYSISTIAILSVIISVIPFQAYGDGFSTENVQANIGNRTISMFIKLNPPILTPENAGDRYLQFRFFDANTNQTLKNVSFYINVTKNNQQLMNDLFYTHSGSLTVKFLPGGSPGQWTVYGDQEPVLGGWMSQTDEVEVQAPIISEGGIYHFHMTMLALDYANTLVNPSIAPRFDSYLNVGDASSQEVNYNSKPYNTTIISFYDKTSDFNFNQSKLQFSWSIPFDWNPSRYQNTPFLVHEELRVPNSFEKFTSYPVFSATVNGSPMNPDKVFLDTYSLTNTTIIHLFVNKDDMQKLSETIGSNASAMNFAVYPSQLNETTSTNMFTNSGGWQIKLGWSPQNLIGGTTNNLNISFYDQLTGQPIGKNIIYDLLVLDRSGGNIISKSNLVALNGTDTQSLDLPSNGIYVIKISVKSISNNNIQDTSRTGTARGNIVIPSIAGQESIPEFSSLASLVLGTSIVLILVLYTKIKPNLKI